MIKLVKENFIAASVPTWVCRAKCPEGEYLRGAGIDKHWVTSSGYMNCVSASGTLLGGRASQKVLDEFNKLPESERKPGAIHVPDLQPNELAIPSPPPGGLVLRVHARFLSNDGNGELRYAAGIFLFNREFHPNSIEAYLGEAEARFLLDDREQSLRILDEAAARQPGDERIAALRARIGGG